MTLPERLFFAPSVVALTSTLSVQLPPAAIVPPLMLMVPVPAVAVGAPPQVLTNPLGVLMMTPVGSVSLKATPDSDCEGFGFVSVKVNAETPVFVAIVVGLNALLNAGA